MEEPNITPERISELSDSISLKINRSLKSIEEINLQVRVLSFNAKIEAARAGDRGLSFGVVASAMGELSTKTALVASALASEVGQDIGELAVISKQLSTDVRGNRLSDLALNNIDLIDRNLYERSCDVRWWATDPSLVEACENPHDTHSTSFAGQRMGVILNAYTVYYDLALCDLDGQVIANGRSEKFRSTGMNVASSEWFRSAMATRSGDEFGFQGVHESPLLNGKRILAYSCGVRKNGEASGKLIGVLGILFNWDALAQTIVLNTPLPPAEKNATRVCITDSSGLVLADTHQKILSEKISFPNREQIYQNKKGFAPASISGNPYLVAHAQSPGFETYATGWHSLILQKTDTSPENHTSS